MHMPLDCGRYVGKLRTSSLYDWKLETVQKLRLSNSGTKVRVRRHAKRFGVICADNRTRASKYWYDEDSGGDEQSTKLVVSDADTSPDSSSRRAFNPFSWIRDKLNMEDTFQSYGNAGDFEEEAPRSKYPREASRSKYSRYDSDSSESYQKDPDPSYSEEYQERGSRRTSGKEFYEARRDRFLMWLDTPSNRSSQFVARLVLSFVVAPIAISSVCRVAIINPVLQTKWDAGWFDLTTSQQEAVADRVERTRQRIEYTSLMGRAPTLSGEEFLEQLREEGQRLENLEMQHNKTSLSNALSDSLCGAIVAATLITNRRRVKLVRTWLGDWCLDLPSSTQAFALLLITDILVGYHSSEGWITVVDNVLGHYGIHPDESFTSIFVAVVPVSLDVVFKYWVFNSLRKLSPSTQIILEQIDKG